MADTKEILETISKNETDLQNENLRWLQNNAKLVHEWKIKIQTFIARLDEEIVYLLNRRCYIRKAIATIKMASNINAECILRRTTKLDGDYHDEIENELNQVCNHRFIYSYLSFFFLIEFKSDFCFNTF